ncbi:hypothetical protein B0J11DRAFT_586826 [Dendryphion nanum]|uniref:Uncharacterized protein n=1 Tax=Dendryphion nanum TaxID=256645 RepID=A0A9P9CW69_9PLEO|nr:hypothetical protein B0J11DRAFT_586826 [Dendryphion nanum]
MYQHLFTVASPFLEEVITKTTDEVEKAWDKPKRDTMLVIPILPPRATSKTFNLTLPNSRSYLQHVSNLPQTKANTAIQPSLSLPTKLGGLVKQIERFTDLYFNLAALENDIKNSLILDPTTISTVESLCLTLAEAIFDLFTTVGEAYNDNPEQLSICSGLSKQIAGIFKKVEVASKITVYQPMQARSRLCAELRHLDLTFFVNSKGLLQCRELNQEVDPNQDAGTLYGFQSKIVLRDIGTGEHRSIITSLG